MKKTSIIYLIIILLVATIFGYLFFIRSKTSVNDDKIIITNKSNNNNINKVLTNQNTYFNKKLGFRVALPSSINFWQEQEGTLSHRNTQKEDRVTFLLNNTSGDDYFLEDPFWVVVHVLNSQDKNAVQWAESGIDAPRILEGYGELSKIVESKTIKINSIECIEQIEKSGEEATTSAYQKIIYCVNNSRIYVIEGYSKSKDDFMLYNEIFAKFVENFEFI
ncbi:MAG: hypothetical protein U5L76_01560 [Patescibacteria group bacterium]|nr:hypothetical protein [Patescibacteria group bacterium]